MMEPTCGNGVLDPGEGCDEGVGNSNNGLCRLDCHESVCGDGFLQPGELCDDGNWDNHDACTMECLLAICGDHFVQPGEECDDGNWEDEDGCTSACMTNICGDGILNKGMEECDEGGPTALCDVDCTVAECGDGLVNGPNGEQCDDGNQDGMDDCTPTCKLPACGDGFLQKGWMEECEDGGTLSGDGCSNECQKEVVTCQNQAEKISLAPSNRAILCQRPNICEMDLAILCPKNWHLCGSTEFNARNDGWNYYNSVSALGVIRCRENETAGQFTVPANFKPPINMGSFRLDNCATTSSRPQCANAQLGCDEKGRYALCCAPLLSCGNGKIDHPEEECDDGNLMENDDCLKNCILSSSNGGSC